MNIIFYIFYNFIVLPFLYSALRICGLFNKKIRTGITGRKRVYEELILSATSINKTKKLIWFHSSSLGEFEQAKPIIEKIKKNALARNICRKEKMKKKKKEKKEKIDFEPLYWLEIS